MLPLRVSRIRSNAGSVRLFCYLSRRFRVAASGFASRRAYRLGYAVQRESPRDKAFRRARKARHKIGGADNLSLPLPGKPKWMRWRTFWRLRGEADRALGAVNEHSAAMVERLCGRIARAA